MGKIDEIMDILPEKIQTLLKKSKIDFEGLQEIRMRTGGPLQIRYLGQKCFVRMDGTFTQSLMDACYIDQELILESFNYIAEYSAYAFQEEIKHGFVTVFGGHRVGIAGKVILEKEKVLGVKYLSSINIRVAHEKKGCANQILPYLFQNMIFKHTLIVSAPGCGKTTLLRDMIRKLSNGGYTVGVVDERSEIGACYRGIPQNDIGTQTDILDACPKGEGILMLVRSMAPQIIAVDEIGSSEDLRAVSYGMQCGCMFLATIHGNTLEDAKGKIGDSIFERYIVLEKAGYMKGIYDEKGEKLCGMLEL